MVLVDTSVWIDYFNGAPTAQCDALDGLLGSELVLMGDLILVEVLQGFRTDAAYREARDLLGTLTLCRLGGQGVALAAVENHRYLRAQGVTVGKTIDLVIATYCLLHGLVLLYSDRAFDPVVQHLGLRVHGLA
ncbi:MAG: PIN domain nuclease [Bdellovibrio bacteriovorus]